MRELSRVDLDRKQQQYLDRKQDEVNASEGADVDKRWEHARKTKTVGGIAEVLKKIAGNRERCMFCHGPAFCQRAPHD